MNLEQRFFKMFGAISILVLAALSIAACGNSALAAQINDGKITICHATDIASTPYEEVPLDFNGLVLHVDHKDDLIPAPVDGCPKVVITASNDGKITICHATDSATNPYNEITIDFNGLRGHSNHKSDIIPAPMNGCPLVTATPGITATPTLTQTPTITPAGTTTGNNDGKITICHATGSKKNPYVLITISVNGMNGHGKHARDIIPAPPGGCPK
jgi:hypothetical protein